MKPHRHFPTLALLAAAMTISAARAGTPAATVAEEEKTSLWQISAETTYTGRGPFAYPRSGRSDSVHGDYSIDRRFPISGRWHLRLGGEYERFDFGGTMNGLPNHLQAIYGHIAYEYIYKDHAAAGIEIDPGVYFQNRITKDSFDIPWKVWVTFPLKKDKVFGVIGAGGSMFQDPVVAPGGGIIWLINDRWRLQAVAPKPALIYTPNDNWEFRLLGEIVYESFRTDDVRNTATGLNLHNAVVQYSEYRAGGQVTYSGFKHVNIFVGGGWSFDRTFDFYRAGPKISVHGAPYVKVGLSAKF